MLIEPAAAIEEAKRGLDLIDWKEKPGANISAGTPLLVSRLDVPGQEYYLVPWRDERGIIIVVQVNGRGGTMSSAITLPTPVPRLVMEPEEARRIAAEKTGRIVTGEPELVWQPCRESSTSFQPFYRVPLEQGAVFLDANGQVYFELTPFGKGG